MCALIYFYCLLGLFHLRWTAPKKKHFVNYPLIIFFSGCIKVMTVDHKSDFNMTVGTYLKKNLENVVRHLGCRISSGFKFSSSSLHAKSPPLALICRRRLPVLQPRPDDGFVELRNLSLQHRPQALSQTVVVLLQLLLILLLV